MKKLHDLKDITFLIPLRLDSINRIENLQMCIEFILDNFNTKIKILEASSINNGILKKILPNEVKITYERDYDPIFHRTKYINRLIKSCNTSYAAIWDADVIVPSGQIATAVELLRSNTADFVLPYKDEFYDVSYFIRELYFRHRDINIFTRNKAKMRILYMPNPVGGGFLVNRKKYIESGMENENFYGWGHEDGERFNRWKILGYNIIQIHGSIFHLTHDRGVNSNFQSNLQKEYKQIELARISAKSKEELRSEIETWTWR